MRRLLKHLANDLRRERWRNQHCIQKPVWRWWMEWVGKQCLLNSWRIVVYTHLLLVPGDIVGGFKHLYRRTEPRPLRTRQIIMRSNPKHSVRLSKHQRWRCQGRIPRWVLWRWLEWARKPGLRSSCNHAILFLGLCVLCCFSRGLRRVLKCTQRNWRPGRFKLHIQLE